MNKNFVITEIKRVAMVGKEEYKEQMISFSPDIKINELVFHFSGHTTIYFDDIVLETHPNTVRFLPISKASRYDVFRYERGECILVWFNADRPVSNQAFAMAVQQPEKLGSLFKKLFATWTSKKDAYYFETLSLLYLIFAEMQMDNCASKQHTMKIAPALEMIHSNFLKINFSIKQLAETCNMGESYFQKLFKEIHGISPKKYIIQLKINYACELLRLDHYNITQVADLCNFSDVYFFSRQFKEYIGISPTQFIKKYRSSK